MIVLSKCKSTWIDEHEYVALLLEWCFFFITLFQPSIMNSSLIDKTVPLKSTALK